MADDVEYEWKVEECDEYGDIVDAVHFDTLAEALAFVDSTPPEGDVVKYEICLVRDQYDHELFSRSHAYLENRTLPPMFDDGRHKVPVRYLREVERLASR